jgi:hypothetical protein
MPSPFHMNHHSVHGDMQTTRSARHRGRRQILWLAYPLPLLPLFGNPLTDLARISLHSARRKPHPVDGFHLLSCDPIRQITTETSDQSLHPTATLAFAQAQRFIAGTPSVAANCTRVISTPQYPCTAASNHEARTQTRITGTMPLRAKQLGPTIPRALGVEAFFFDDALNFFPDLLALFFNLIQSLPTNRKFFRKLFPQFVFDAP